MEKPELLAPAGDMTSLRAAVKAGADAVYFGVRGLNMRSKAKNFSMADMKKVVAFCKKHGVRTYLALNTIIYDGEIGRVRRILSAAKRAGISAVILWDMAVLKEAKKLGLEIHISTQASVANSRAAESYRRQGSSRIILARECSLDQIRAIRKKTKIEIEVFVHGAMCVSLSGRCFLSQFSCGKSGNRGECLQPCRRKYLAREVGGKGEYVIGEDYIMSPRDLCTMPFIEKLVLAGIDSFKIEGRGRGPEYVATAVRAYRRALDFCYASREAIKRRNKSVLAELGTIKKEEMANLKKVFNRGFSEGFYMGRSVGQWTRSSGSLASRRKVHVGKVVHYYSKIGVAEILVEASRVLKVGDDITVQGEATGLVEFKAESLEIEHERVEKAGKGDKVAVKVPEKVRVGDKVHKMARVRRRE